MVRLNAEAMSEAVSSMARSFGVADVPSPARAVQVECQIRPVRSVDSPQRDRPDFGIIVR
jgi:hypothetical protein